MADANRLKWNGTWRSTFLKLPQELIPALDCSSVYSDVLHRPFVCSNININKYATTIPARNQITRMETMTSEEFADRWTQTPFILTKYIQDWPALRKWNFDYFSTHYRDVVFRAEAVDWTYETYSKYMSSTSDESPLYLFDHKFVEKMGVTVGKDADSPYSRPECFGPDLFEPFGAERPDYRWLIIGPKGSGSTFHKDPNATSAWNAVIEGSKYWITFPPDTLVPGVFASSDSSEVTSPQSIAEWLLEFQAEARKLPGCVEAVCEAGEILHIPSGWWHLVVNIEPGIALTQNFVPKTPSLYHLSEALGFLRDKPDQVTGFTCDVADPYQLFADRLREQNPGLLEEALEVLEANKESRKRKWDVAVGPCDEDAGGGFSFGFGSDDDEEIP